MHKNSLHAHKITKVFYRAEEKIVVLQELSATFVQGSTYAIMGVSGSGKSTFLHLLAGLDMPTTGSIQFNNCPIENFSTREREYFLQQHIGYVFQQPFLIAELSVLENVMLKGLIRGESYYNVQEIAYTLLAHVGLQDKAHYWPTTLSGGQQQRVALARALYGNPCFLLADEPTAHLDPATKYALMQLLIRTVHSHKIGIILSTHDQQVATACDTILELEQGQLHMTSYARATDHILDTVV